LRTAALEAKAEDQKLQAWKDILSTVSQINIKLLCLEPFISKVTTKSCATQCSILCPVLMASILKAEGRSSSTKELGALLKRNVHPPQ
jgi:hypothetical protein